jgi:hypothetical protein
VIAHRRSFSLSLCVVLSLAACGVLAGCMAATTSSTTSTPTPPAANSAALAANGATSFYVAGTSNATVLRYPIATPNAPPAVLTMPSTFEVESIAVDSKNSVLYVGGSLSSATATIPEVLAYPVGSTGTTPPTRTIVGGAASFYLPDAIGVEGNGVLYVGGKNGTQEGVIAVYPANANGAAVPTQLIQGSATDLSQEVVTDQLNIGVDGSGNIYDTIRSIANGVLVMNVLVFSPGASGNVAPIRALILSGFSLQGAAVSASGSLALATYQGTATPAGTVVKYAANANGAAASTGMITPVAVDDFFRAIAGDSVGNLYILDYYPSGASSAWEVLGYGPGASGTVPTPGVELPIAGYSAISGDPFAVG